MALSQVFITHNNTAAYRAIGPEASGGPSGQLILMADVTEREEHHDETVITEHPVQRGAPVSDHAYNRPSELRMRVDWSNAGRTDPQYVNAVYAQLLALRNDRWPMDVYTGKRIYANMLIAGIVVETDQTKEYALFADIYFRQVILVNTQTFSVSSDPTVQSDPSSTQPTANAGSKVPTGGFNTVRSGTGPTEIPTGENPGAPATGGFPSLQTGDGPTQIPSGAQTVPTTSPNDAVANPIDLGPAATPF